MGKQKIFALALCCLYAIFLIKVPVYNFAVSKVNRHLSYTNLIAHACGAYHGIAYTNSLNALERNFEKGFRIFEIDFSLTTDNKVIMLHDTSFTMKDLFGSDAMRFTHEKFIKSKTKYNLDLMDIDILANWLKNHTDAYVIIDYKKDGMQILKSICDKCGEILQRFYVQIYTFEEYSDIREMGFGEIILTLYMSAYRDEDIVNFVRENNIYAVTMPVNRAETQLPMILKKINVRVFAHTVNSKGIYSKLLYNGVYGIYTDSIYPWESHLSAH